MKREASRDVIELNGKYYYKEYIGAKYRPEAFWTPNTQKNKYKYTHIHLHTHTYIPTHTYTPTHTHT